jgi:hypothetical protein
MLSQNEFEEIISDLNKRIEGDILWNNDEDHFPAVEFRKAYVPPDITALITEPVTVWQQFCLESSITHNGIMQEPPPLQLDLFL